MVVTVSDGRESVAVEKTKSVFRIGIIGEMGVVEIGKSFSDGERRL